MKGRRNGNAGPEAEVSGRLIKSPAKAKPKTEQEPSKNREKATQEARQIVRVAADKVAAKASVEENKKLDKTKVVPARRVKGGENGRPGSEAKIVPVRDVKSGGNGHVEPKPKVVPTGQMKSHGNGNTEPEIKVVPAPKPKERQLKKLAVVGITGPRRRLKKPGPYTYAVNVAGGKPPYSVEWSGNAVIKSAANRQQVELTRDQTWDSGKGNWVFIRVKDADGNYARWVDKAGIAKTIFTYGVTYRNKVVVVPAEFPSDEP
jgi:hypothetical protein